MLKNFQLPTKSKNRTFIIWVCCAVYFCLAWSVASGQVNPCTGNTPSYTFDLTGNPDSTWVSMPPVPRSGSCCGSTSPDRCIVFLFTLDSAVVAINFEIIDGAVPGGSLFYQIDCGPPIAVGDPICLNGPGPYALSFCKPGNNLNIYAITTLSGPQLLPDQTVGVGCSITLSTTSLDPSTVTWMDITSGTGLYDSYLSCTVGCTTTVVTPQNPTPPYVDYVVCGTPLTPACMPPSPYCDTIRVFIIPGISVVISPNPAVFCENSPGILLSGTVSGGDSSYTYTWTNSNGTIVSDSLNYFAVIPGTYVLEVSDGSSSDCSGFDTVTVIAQPIPVVNAGNDISMCETITSITLNGTVTNATGGIWSGGNGQFIPSNLTLNTTYIPTATEIANGYVVLTLTSTGNGLCPSATDQILISFSPSLNLTISGPTIVCYGEAVTLSASVSGGIPPYTYYWSTGDSTQSITAGAGTYYVSVSDASLFPCIENAAITIQENPELTISVSPDDSINCDTIVPVSVTASGGTGSYTYLWQNGQTSTTIFVTPGTYLVTVTDGAGCTAVDTVTVVSNNSSLAASITPVPVLCYGEIIPITVVATGGLGFYSYLWDNGMTTNTINVSAGNYCVLVSDMIGCWTTVCITISENPQLNATVSGYTPTCAGTDIPITANATGGQLPYTYLWNTGQNTQSIMQPSGTYSVTITDANSCSDTASITVFNEDSINIAASSSSTSCYNGSDGSATVTVTDGISPYFYSWSPWGGNTSTATNLSAGTYLVTVTDALGCTAVESVIVGQPLPVSASISFTSPSCFGSSDGSAIATAIGGTTPHVYYWSPTSDSGAVITGIPEGLYNVLVTDSLGCTGYGSVYVTAPSILTVSIISTSISCTGGNDGTVTVSVSGGIPSYTYQWSPNVSTTSVATNLSAGIYFITVIDSMGCVHVSTIVLSELQGLSLGITSIVDVSCFGWNNGQATVSVSGGTAPYNYYWTSGETGPNASFLSAGNNTVTVTDINGCQDSISVNINQPSQLITSTTDQNILCDSTVTLTVAVSGGTPSYSYLWSTGAVSSSIFSNTPGVYTVIVTDAQGCMSSDTVNVIATNSILAATIAAPGSICYDSTTVITANPTGGVGGGYWYLWSTGQTTNSITVGSGTYCVMVTDSTTGCNITVCVTLIENDSLQVFITPDIICYNSTGTIAAVVSGGLQPYSYLWSTGSTASSITDSAGVYSITVTDSIGCTITTTSTIAESAEMIIGFVDVYNVSCNGGSNGTATVTVTNGFSPFTYQWSPGGDSSSAISGLTVGIYTVTVTDSLGCSKSNNITITEPSLPLVLDSISGNNLDCNGGNNGSAAILATGGAPPYNYLWWETGDTVSSISGLSGGVYNVSVADTNGCVASTSITLTEPPLLNLAIINIQNITCFGINNASAEVQVTGGTPLYTYAWTLGGGTDSVATGLSQANYSVTVTDLNGCNQVATVSFSEPAELITIATGSTSICIGESTTISVSAIGGSGNYTYTWDQGLGFGAVQIVNPDTTTVYTVIVSDSNGCTDNSQSVTVNVSAPLSVAFATSDSICEGDSASIFVTVSGGNGNYSYIWSDSTFGNSPGPHIVVPGFTTTYTVVVLDSCGSPPATASVTVMVSPLPNATIVAEPGEGCDELEVVFTAVTTGNPPGTTYLWTFDDGSSSDSIVVHQYYDQTGSYTASLTVTTGGCEIIITADGVVQVYTSAVAGFNAYPSVTSISNPIINFTNTSLNASSWIWDFGDGSTSSESDPQHIYSDTGTYLVQLIVNNEFGCPDTIFQWVIIEPDYAYFIPNVFFPGSKSINNVFIGKGFCVTGFEMYIYNRWGDLIYETKDINEPWDGRANEGKEIAQQDVYVYVIKTLDCLREEHQYIGHVTLIR